MSTQGALYNMPHTPIDASRPRTFGIQTGAARDRATNLPISGHCCFIVLVAFTTGLCGEEHFDVNETYLWNAIKTKAVRCSQLEKPWNVLANMPLWCQSWQFASEHLNESRTSHRSLLCKCVEFFFSPLLCVHCVTLGLESTPVKISWASA